MITYIYPMTEWVPVQYLPIWSVQFWNCIEGKFKVLPIVWILPYLQSQRKGNTVLFPLWSWTAWAVIVLNFLLVRGNPEAQVWGLHNHGQAWMELPQSVEAERHKLNGWVNGNFGQSCKVSCAMQMLTGTTSILPKLLKTEKCTPSIQTAHTSPTPYPPKLLTQAWHPIYPDCWDKPHALSTQTAQTLKQATHSSHPDCSQGKHYTFLA